MKTLAILIGVLGVSWIARAGIVDPPPPMPDEVLQKCSPEARAGWQRNYSDLVRWQQALEQSAKTYNAEISAGVPPMKKAELKAMRRSLEKGVEDYAYCLKYFQERLNDVHPASHFDPGPSLALVEMLNLLEHSDQAIRDMYDSNKIRALRKASWAAGSDPLVEAAFVARIEQELTDIEKRWPAVTDFIELSSPNYLEDKEQGARDRILTKDLDLGKVTTYSETQLATFVNARRDARQRELIREWMRNWEGDRLHVLKIKAPGLTFQEAMKNPEVAKAYAQRIRETDDKYRTAIRAARDLALKEMYSIVDERAKKLNAGSARDKWLATWNKSVHDMNAWKEGELAWYLDAATAEDKELAEYLGPPASQKPQSMKIGDIPGAAKIRNLWENDVKFKARAIEAGYRARVNEAKAATDAFIKNWDAVVGAAKEMWSKE